jgi:nitroreductase
MNEIIKLLKSHTSIRKFNDSKITDEQVQHIIESAMQGATAGNMMAYSIIKIKSKDTLSKLAKSCDNQPFIADADLALLFVADNYKWHKFYEQRNIYETFPDYNGPCISDFMLGVEDGMIAAQNAVIAAESLGIGTCYIGDIMENYEYHKELFNLPQYTMPIALVVMGNYDTKPQTRERFDKSYVVFDESYPKITEEFIDNMFSREESKDKDFAVKFYKRKMDAPFFKEMIRTIKLYINEWNHYDLSIVNEITQRMIEFFENDVHQINHALKVYGFAKTICEMEDIPENKQLALEIAAVLHDIGIPESIKKYGSGQGKYQEIKGPPIARELLKDYNLHEDIKERVFYLIGNHHSYNNIDDIDFQILVEADFFVNIYENNLDKDQILNIKTKYFKTNTGKKLIDSMYL